MEGSSSNGAVSSGSIITRQLKGRDIWNSSKRWRKKGPKKSLEQIEGLEMASGNGVVLRKRVMVLVDQSTCAKDAMMWALTHVVNKGDHLTLLEIIPPRKDQRKILYSSGSSSCSASADFAESLVLDCKNFKPEVCSLKKPNQGGRNYGVFWQQVEVHALAIQGAKLPTVIFQVKKLQVSVLVLGQKKAFSSPDVCLRFHRLCSLYRSSSEDFVEQCISNAECLTVAVRKQSRDVGGYLISTRWQKNFWLLA
ncbi:Adenine nucleotide alpha hydrolases-like superfamily protein [Cinnamomum micranthum f. kanehirae]|uniref:Adenine nucleotide alpha hydrolases-like superfamily protein n=1 Tax=Cinnamomum micranthum f. kanehirae TaxID=337451 RepID=A0A3S3MTR1_9MAGN|nr:Adenine nucleotide alpha hydrolases-like superfamily protein [Cinnamomum micranthum f. kanehirae]